MLLVEDDHRPVRLDPAGYFVIYPVTERRLVHIEHYANDNRLLHSLESASPRALYLKIIDEGWVTEMSHAAYLGKELFKAEFALRTGTAYLQDAA